MLTSILYIGGYLYSRNTAPGRVAIEKYVSFVVPFSLLKSAGRFMMAADVFPGYCIYDASKAIFYFFYPAIVYIVLKRDSQYWTEDITKQDDYSSGYLDQTRKEELPNYEDVVIPKTELYFQSKIEQRMDTSLQLHLWRRKIVFVKVFQMDFLTRDSIKNFKVSEWSGAGAGCGSEPREVWKLLGLWRGGDPPTPPLSAALGFPLRSA